MNFAAYFAPETSAWVVESLAHILWQGTLVAGLAALATLLMRNRSAQARYCVHCTAMLLTAACLPLNLFLLAPTDRGEKSSVMRSVSIDSAEEVLSPASNDTAPIVVNKSLVPIDETPIDRRIAAEAAPSLADTPEVTFAWEWASGWIVSAYIAGIVVMAIRLMMGLYGTQRLRKTARPVEEASLHSVLQRIGERLTLKVLPVVAYSARVTTPLVVGVIKPVILLPAAILSDLTTEQVESLLLHELAHIRRYDHWVNLIQRVIEAVLFFHPAVWWLSHKVSIEREHCCDDLAIHWGSKPCDYAESLVRISEVRYRTAGLSGSGATTLAATGSRSSQLRGRVLRVLGMPLPGPSVGLTRVGLVALLIVGGLLFVSPLLWHAQASPDSGGASRDESSIANEHIVPGIGFREYRIGKSKLKEILGEDSAENRRKWKERGYTFEFNQGRELTAISFHLPEFTTAEGIGPGSSIEEMREAYPEAKLTSVKNDKFKYAIWRTKGVEFWPDGKGRVAAVRVSANSAKESSQKGVATISGKIVFEDGSPATSKGWLYSDSSIKVGEHSTNSTASTEGQFTESFSCEVPAGTVSLAYFPEGYAPTWAGPFELKPGQNLDEITLTLKAGFSAKLILQNEDGKPVPDATVVAHPRHNDSIHGPVVEQLTDESGELLLKHLVKTSYEFTITAPGYQPLRTKPLRIEEGETFRPTMVRSKPAMGIIRFADGKPAPFSKIRVISEYREDGRTQGFGNDGEGFWGQVLTTADASGRFRLDQLTNGSHYLFVIEAVDGARAIVDHLKADMTDAQVVIPLRKDLVVYVKGNLGELQTGRGKPFISVRQPVKIIRPDGGTRGELIGADATIEPVEGGGRVIFRGLAVDLREDAPQQTVRVSLGYDHKTQQTAKINPNGNTVVKFDLTNDTEADSRAAAEKGHRLKVLPARKLTKTNDISDARKLTPERLIEWSPDGNSTEWLLLDKDQTPLFTERDVESAEVKPAQGGKAWYNVAITLTEASGKRMKARTTKLLKDGVDPSLRLLVQLDDKVLLAPKLMSVISRKCELTGIHSPEQVRTLREALSTAIEDQGDELNDVVEVAMSLGSRNALLDLDTGKTLGPMQQGAPSDVPKYELYVSSEVLGNRVAPVLFGQGKRQLQVDEESWKNPSEKKLRQWLNRLKTPMQPVRLARQPGPYPRTWAVETNEERIALVQIVNFEERIETELSGRVPGYIVRYRLLSEQVASDQDDANEKSEANEWGEVIDGVQARLIPKKLVWPEGSPPEFDIEVRTLPTAKNYTLPRVVMQLDVEIDGKWNSWRGRRLIAGYFGRSGDGESISEPYRPFHQPLILDANWGRDWELTRQAQNKLEISDKDFVAKHPVLNALMPGKHTVRVKIIGELVTQPVEIEVVTNTERGTTPITISGRALDIEDKPIRGATVYLASVPPMIFPSPKQSEPRLVAQTTTDGEGNYRFENTPFPVGENDMMGGGRITGKFQVFAVSAGKAMAWHPVREFDPNWPTTKGKHHHGYGRDDTIEIDLTLRQPVSIRGRVIDEDGQPIAGTQLALVHADTDWKIEQFLRNLDRQEHVLAASDPFYALFWPDVVPEELALRVTDKTGAFEFTRLPRDCRLHLRVKPPGYKPLSAWVLTEPSDPTLTIRNDAQRNIFGNDFTLVVDRDTAESEAAKADLEEEVNRRSYVQLSPASAALLKQLQGTWQVETQSSDGNESMIAHVEGEQIRLCKPNGEDPMTFDFGLIGGKPYHRIKLTPKISAAQRQAILAEIEFDPELAPLVLASNGFPGIIEASDDGFRICVCGEPGGERPMLFTVNKSQGLWILKRPVNSEPEANSEKVNDSATLKIKSLSDESGSDAEIFID